MPRKALHQAAKCADEIEPIRKGGIKSGFEGRLADAGFWSMLPQDQSQFGLDGRKGASDERAGK